MFYQIRYIMSRTRGNSKVAKTLKKVIKSKSSKTKRKKKDTRLNHLTNPYFQEGSIEQTNAKKGNRFWENRSRHGREKIFSDPIAMVEAAEDYFKHVDANPWKKAEWKGKRMVHLPTQMPYTWDGFCLYIGTAHTYFQNFKARLSEDNDITLKLTPSERVGFAGAISMIEKMIRNQKYNGAAAGYFKENLISYDLGIRKDEAQMEISGSGISIIVKDDEDKELIESIRKKLKE